MILLLKPYASKSSIKFLANVYLVILATSNTPRISCFGFQLDPKKFMTKTNTSCAPLDVATPLLEDCEDDTHTPEMGTWESSGTPKILEFDCRGQNTLL
jgi:hypothetical protein